MKIYLSLTKATIGPQMEFNPTPFKTIKAHTSGTKWHNEPGDKKWHEAKSDDGHTFYWNSETHGMYFI